MFGLRYCSCKIKLKWFILKISWIGQSNAQKYKKNTFLQEKNAEMVNETKRTS